MLLYSDDLKSFAEVLIIQDDKHTERLLLMNDNRFAYQMIQKELNIEFTAIYKIIHEELQMKKVICRWVPHNLTEHTKKRSLSKSAKKLLNC